MLKSVGKKTKMLTRFSTVSGEKGSADSARDPRGFAIKFCAEEGNWGWVFNNTPVFFLRDPAKSPVFIHTRSATPKPILKMPVHSCIQFYPSEGSSPGDALFQ